MSRKTIYNKNISAPAEITNEEYESVGASKIQLGDSRRFFLGANDFEVYTEPSTGTKLVEGVDYQLLDLDANLSTLCAKPVFSSLIILNSEYQNCKLFLNYRCVLSQLDAKQMNAMQLQIDANKSLNETQSAILTDHESRITANTVKNTDQDNLIAEIINKNTAQDEAHEAHVNNSEIHVTAADKSRWDGKANTYLVDNIAARDALTGLNINDVVFVKDDGDGKRAGYYYNGAEASVLWEKFSDPDWENVSLDWSALENIPQVLNDLSDNGSGELLYKGSAIGGEETPDWSNIENIPQVLNDLSDNGSGELLYKGSAVGGGTIISGIDSDYTLSTLTQNTKLYFEPSQDRSVNITAGAASVGIRLFLYHSGSGNFKETVTYATGQTLVLTRKRYAILESVPGGWLFVKESRIGQMEHGYIIPRGAVELAGQLRDKDALWHYITEYYSSLIVTEAEWQAGDCLKFADYSETQYRVSDWRGIFERNAGTNSKLKMANGTAYSGDSPATKKLDMMFGHKHINLQVDGNNIDWEFDYGGGGGWGFGVQDGDKEHGITTVSIISDGNNGTPNIGPETAPVSGSKYAYIYTED